MNRRETWVPLDVRPDYDPADGGPAVLAAVVLGAFLVVVAAALVLVAVVISR